MILKGSLAEDVGLGPTAAKVKKVQAVMDPYRVMLGTGKGPRRGTPQGAL